MGGNRRAKEELTMTKYYAAVYTDGRGRVLQVTDDIDCLSCEILAKPGVIGLDCLSALDMRHWSMQLARDLFCHHLEINCSKGKGSYRWLRRN